MKGASVPVETAAPQDQDEKTVRLARRRFARRNRARRLRALRPLLVALAVVAAVGGLVWLFFFSSVLAVRGVSVVGTHLLSPSQVRAAADVPLGRPLAAVDLDAIQARVEDLAPVAAVEVSRSWPHRVRIVVSERQAVAVVDKEGTLWGVDDDGVLFRRYRHRPEGMPSVHMKAGTDTDALAEAAKVVRALPPGLARKLEYVDVSTVDEIALRLRNGAVVQWGSSEQSATKAEVLGVLLRTEPSSQYDVTAPGQPTVVR